MSYYDLLRASTPIVQQPVQVYVRERGRGVSPLVGLVAILMAIGFVVAGLHGVGVAISDLPASARYGIIAVIICWTARDPLTDLLCVGLLRRPLPATRRKGDYWSATWNTILAALVLILITA